ncbi:multicopper oxidase [Amanita thiersii Skay4041]|uniref:Multicopper oxidase n=1 Tax=Amanita thiersii Skay4041 TaxID=703135 RepID=A0A2A9N8C6_9AGAR|nr:multicopper oxidase [Amanita thiersii Skay4041]
MLAKMHRFVFLALCLAVGSSFAKSIGPKATIEITNQVLAPDGYQRSATVAKGSHPGPLIMGKKGDTFELNVVNGLTDDTMLRSTSIHWHGLFQRGSNWADGPVGINQCPIAPDESFLYRFSVPDQAGTYWYHSHFGNQYCDGLRGPLVVYDPQDPHRRLYDVDNESTIITLADWYHVPSPSIKGVAMLDSTLINGVGRYVGGPQVDLAVVNVKWGRRYRFRLVSISCDPNFVFSIDGHQLTVIEADGQSTEPVTVDSIQIYAGQRYSFVLSATQPIDNYWIRALPNKGVNKLSSGFDGGVNSAILRYKGATRREPQSMPKQNPVMLQETDLHPLTNPQAPGQPNKDGADLHLDLVPGFDPMKKLFTMNGKSFTSPTVPVLLQILSGARRAQDLLPMGSLYQLKRGDVVELTVPGGSVGGPHPFHLHGHTFSVVRSAGNNTAYNYENPVRRDVVNIGDAGSQVTIRFVADNPGPWFFHCHIDWHLSTGMAVVFVEDTEETQVCNPAPPSWDQLCPTYNALPANLTEVHTLAPSTTPK